jgi:hypothetical protein
LVPACPLAGLAGFADQHHEKVETMAGGIDHAVGRGANGIAERLATGGGWRRDGLRCVGPSRIRPAPRRRRVRHRRRLDSGTHEAAVVWEAPGGSVAVSAAQAAVVCR